MNKQELELEMKKLNDGRQEQFMSSILEKVELLLEKYNRAGYEMTVKEKFEFDKIVTIINAIDKGL